MGSLKNGRTNSVTIQTLIWVADEGVSFVQNFGYTGLLWLNVSVLKSSNDVRHHTVGPHQLNANRIMLKLRWTWKQNRERIRILLLSEKPRILIVIMNLYFPSSGCTAVKLKHTCIYLSFKTEKTNDMWIHWRDFLWEFWEICRQNVPVCFPVMPRVALA